MLQERNNEQDELRRRNSILDKTMREKEVFELEIARLREMVRNRDKEIEDIQSRKPDAELRARELLSLEGAIKDRDSKIEMLKKELDRISDLEGKRSKEREAEIKYLKELLDERNKELHRLKRNMDDSSQLDSKIRDYENKITLFMNEIERLNRILKEKTTEADSLFRSLEICEEDKKIIERQLKQYQEDNEHLERQLGELKLRGLGSGNKESNLGNQTYLKAEVDRLNQLIIDKNRETDNIKQDLQLRIFRLGIGKNKITIFI